MDRTELEANPRVRYGFYLRPSATMSRAQTEIHDLLRRQFGTEVGGKFMPHATIMSFFRSDASVQALIEAIDPVVNGRAPFPVWNGGPIRKGRGFVLDVHHDAEGQPNPAIRSIHDAAFAAIIPHVHPACEFAFGGWSGERFHAHLTLAMADVPSFAVDEIRDFLGELEPIGPSRFTAEYVHLYAFQSDDWGGEWWRTMSWQFVHSWKLEG